MLKTNTRLEGLSLWQNELSAEVCNCLCSHCGVKWYVNTNHFVIKCTMDNYITAPYEEITYKLKMECFDYDGYYGVDVWSIIIYSLISCRSQWYQGYIRFVIRKLVILVGCVYFYLGWFTIFIVCLCVQGAQFLAQGLQINKTLLWLGLGSNQIEAQGVWALTESLRSGSPLLWLGLGGNSIGDRGVLHLASLLQGV